MRAGVEKLDIPLVASRKRHRQPLVGLAGAISNSSRTDPDSEETELDTGVPSLLATLPSPTPALRSEYAGIVAWRQQQGYDNDSRVPLLDNEVTEMAGRIILSLGPTSLLDAIARELKTREDRLGRTATSFKAIQDHSQMLHGYWRWIEQSQPSTINEIRAPDMIGLKGWLGVWMAAYDSGMYGAEQRSRLLERWEQKSMADAKFPDHLRLTRVSATQGSFARLYDELTAA